MSDGILHLGHGFTAAPSLSIGVFVVSDNDGAVRATFDYSTPQNEMVRWVEGYVACQATVADGGKVRLCGMAGAAR